MGPQAIQLVERNQGLKGLVCDASSIVIEAISKKFFGPISVLVPYFNASEYCSMHPKGTSCGHLRIEVRVRLEREPKPYFLR